MRFLFKRNFLLLLIILLAGVLRFYHLGSDPASLNWDEAAIGWNAKTIWETRLDEYGTHLPWSFKSFGDYKAPVYIYLTAPFVGLLGANPISVRLVSVLAGIASVYLIYLITNALLLNSGLRTPYTAPLAALLMAITPWQVILSRPAFEANLALMFVLSGTYLFLKSLTKPKYYLFSVLSFVLSFYTYHSPKIFVPVFLLGIIFIFRRQIFVKKNSYWLIGSVTLGLLLLIPLIKEIVFQKGANRFESTSIFYEKDQPLPLKFSLINQAFKNYIIHYSPAYLFSGSSLMPQLQLKTVGPLLLIEAPFLLMGLIYLLKKRSATWSKLLFWWLIVGPIPAMIGRDVPHPLRSDNVLPALIIITAIGLVYFLRLLKSQLRTLVVILFIVNLAYFLYHYFVVYPVYSAPVWQYGYQLAADFARQQENQVNKIIITSTYGQPYIFTYFYQDRKAASVFWGAMSKYLFRNINWPEDSQKSNVLIIGSPEEIPADAVGIIKVINFPDGQPAFRIVKTPL
ncbi:MAG: glycosyltransferase family 39 protein [Candidatus Beckwithbacteria bacterium]|nr:glycosyltransferase family 39 protein [Candidatus Beckwithbacteria bacterium]